MKTVGRRKQRPLNFSASADLLKEGARFNETLQAALPTGNTTFIPKGVYVFKTLEEADRHRDQCMIEGMAREARKRS